MHDLRWVHRDVSADNILIVDGDAKLVDLEYCRTSTDTAWHNVRTVSHIFRSLCNRQLICNCCKATKYFLPVEAQLNTCLYDYKPPMALVTEAPSPSTNKPRGHTGDWSDSDSEDPGDDILPSGPAPLAIKKPFAYTPLHDLESLIWIGIYFVLCRIERGRSDDPDFAAELKAQKAYATLLFHSPDPAQRMLVFTKCASFGEKLAKYLSPALKTIGEKLVETAMILAKCYELEQTVLPQNLDFFTIAHTNHIHKKVAKKFAEIHAILKAQDILVDRIDDPDLNINAGCSDDSAANFESDDESSVFDSDEDI